MTLRISDLVVHEDFQKYVIMASVELSRLFQSGIMVRDPVIDAIAKQNSVKTVHLPFFNDLAGDSNIGSDDPGVNATPNGITTGQDIAVKHFRNNGWRVADLSAAFTYDDPMKWIAERIGSYWAREYQKILVASLRGLIADNEANDAGDMVVDIATDDVAAVADAERISNDAIIGAQETMGDAVDLTAIAMHSVVYNRLLRQDQITFVPASEGKAKIPFYLEKEVIVDDGMPAVSGTNRITYYTALFGGGACAWGEGAPKTPQEIERVASAGNGEGVETIWSRQHFIMHPRGIAFQNASITGESPTNTELQDATEWDRVYNRKQVRMAFIKTNG